MPAHPLALELLRSLDFPLRIEREPFGYGRPPHGTWPTELGEKILYILDGGPCAVGVGRSSSWGERAMRALSGGGIPWRTSKAVIGRLGSAQGVVLPAAPGIVESTTRRVSPLVGNVSALLREHAGKRCSVISFTAHYDSDAAKRFTFGDADEAARNLFAAIRASCGDDHLAEVFPMTVLGWKHNDRLRRSRSKAMKASMRSAHVVLAIVLTCGSQTASAQTEIRADSIRRLYEIPEMAYAVVSWDSVLEMPCSATRGGALTMRPDRRIASVSGRTPRPSQASSPRDWSSRA